MNNVTTVKMHSDIANELYELLIYQPNPISACDVCGTYHFQKTMTARENDLEEACEVCNECIGAANLLWGGDVIINTYEVMIQAKITKCIIVDATTQEEAEELAHQQFSVLQDGDERYEQDTYGETELIK